MPRSPRTTTAPKTQTQARKAPAKPTPQQRATDVGKTTARRLATAEQTEHPLMYVPIDQVVPSPDNPRGEHLADLSDLQHSIRAHGVLEPLTVGAAGDDGNWPLIFGHRRLAAARLAGVTVVPAVVRADLDPAQTAVARLVENLQRVDLTPLEEARGYQQLRHTHGMKQVDIAAAVGRNQGHISKRLALLTLPEPIAVRAGRPVDKGGIPLDVAIDVSKLPGAAQVDLVDASHADDDQKWIGADRFAMAIRSTARGAETAAHQRGALTKLRKAKIAVLNVDGDTITKPPAYDDATGPAPIWRLLHDDDLIEGHVKLACNAAVITDYPQHMMGGAVVGAATDDDLRYVQMVCTDPASHAGDVASANGKPAAKRRQTKAEKDQAARDDALAAAAAARTDFVRGLVTSGKLPAAGTQAFLLRSFIVSTVDPDAMLEIDLSTVAQLLSTPDDQPAGVATLTAYAGGDALQRYVVATVCAAAEREVSRTLSRLANDGHVWPGALLTARLYLAYLAQCGYQLRDAETLPDDPGDELAQLLIESGDLPGDDQPAPADDAAPAADAAAPVDDRPRITCPVCQGTGRIGTRDDLCANCDGYGVIIDPAAQPAAAAASG